MNPIIKAVFSIRTIGFLIVLLSFISNSNAKDVNSSSNKTIRDDDVKELSSGTRQKREIVSLSSMTVLIKQDQPLLTRNLPSLASTVIPIVAAAASLISAFVALYLGYFKERWRRPILELGFKETSKEPFWHRLSFDAYNYSVPYQEGFLLYRSGVNVRVKVKNTGEITAKKVQARIEKIEITDNANETKSFYYHPTAIKWSGEKTWNAVDIVHGSHFFLDLFYSINETVEEVISWNYNIQRSRGSDIDKSILDEVVRKGLNPPKIIHWNVWVQEPENRGLRRLYIEEGNIKAHFILNAENCEPLRFIANIRWNRDNWANPQIQIIQKEIINCGED